MTQGLGLETISFILKILCLEFFLYFFNGCFIWYIYCFMLHLWLDMLVLMFYYSSSVNIQKTDLLLKEF